MPSLPAAFPGAVPFLILATAVLVGELPVRGTSPRFPVFCLAAERSGMSRPAGSASSGKSQTGGTGGGGGGGGEQQSPSQHRSDIGPIWGGYPVVGFPGMFPGFHTLDRLYTEMMDNVDRLRSEMERLYYPPFGVGGAVYPPALGGGAAPPALRAGSGNLPLATAGGGGAAGSVMPYYRGGRGSSFDAMSPFYSPMFSGGSMLMPFSRGASAVVPRVDFQDVGNEYLLQADLPGIDKNNVKIQVHNGVLHISGEQQQQQETRDQQKGYFMQERYQSSFSRSLPLPENVREDDIRATMKDGVLQVHLPKIPSEKANVKKVNVE